MKHPAPNGFPVYLLLLLCCRIYCIQGQGYTEIATFQADYLPLQTKGSSLDGARFALHALLPLPVGKTKSGFLLAGLNTEAIIFNSAEAAPGTDRLFGVTPMIGYNAPVNDRLKVTALFMPFFHSDLQHGEGGQLRFAAMVRTVVKESEAFTWRITAGYRDQFFGPQYVLLAGMDWKVNERLRLFGDLPQNFSLSFQAGKKSFLGLTYLANLLSYNLSGKGQYLLYNYAHTSLFAELLLTPNLALRAEAGYALTRKFERYADAERPDATLIFFRIGDKTEPLNEPYNKGPVFRLAAAYRVY